MRSDARAQDILWEEGSFENALAGLEMEFGAPQPNVNQISPDLLDTILQTWFLEDVSANYSPIFIP